MNMSVLSKQNSYVQRVLYNLQLFCFNMELLKFGFCNKLFRKDETLTSWTLLQHICSHFWAWLLLYSAITPKSEDKYVVKVVNWSEFHFSEVTFFQNWYFSSSTIYRVTNMYWNDFRRLLWGHGLIQKKNLY